MSRAALLGLQQGLCLALPALRERPAAAGSAGVASFFLRHGQPSLCPPCGEERWRCLGTCCMTSSELWPSFDGVSALPCPTQSRCCSRSCAVLRLLTG